MKRYTLDAFTNGWVVGDFSPHIFVSKDIEVGVKHYKKGDHVKQHVHKIADEITIIISGVFIINKERLVKNDILLIERGLPGECTCEEDGSTVVIKSPSLPFDKYYI